MRPAIVFSNQSNPTPQSPMTRMYLYSEVKRSSNLPWRIFMNAATFFMNGPQCKLPFTIPGGREKSGKERKGGTYYIDVYSDISTDYFLYINKTSLLPYIESRELNGIIIRNVRKEVELAIILFHNVFPERTFQLEHFYMPLYHLKDDDFDINYDQIC